MDVAGLFRCELSYPERLRLAWQLAWPVFLLDLLVIGVAYAIVGPKLTDLYVAYALLAMLIVYPFVVRRMVKLRYPGFRLKMTRDGAEAEMGYTESFKVAWLLGWRTEILSYLVLFIVSPLAQLLPFQLSSLVPSTQEAPLFNIIGLSLFSVLAGLVLSPLVMPGMFSKQYQGFRLVAERAAAAPVSRRAPAR